MQSIMLLSQAPDFFKSRRDRLMKANPTSAFLFASNREFVRNPDVEYPFRQESNLHYLSGFPEPESFLVIAPSGKAGQAYRSILFVRRKNVEKEMWEGARYGVEAAAQVFGMDESYPIDELEKKLPELLQGSEKVHYRLGIDDKMDRLVLGAMESARRSLGRTGRSLIQVADPNEVVGEMRLFKAPEEIDYLRKACQITAEAHKLAMQEVRPGMNEYEVEALVDYTFRRHGCQRVGYGSIVAGGKNATCLHYRGNNQPLRDGDLLLIDAGGEFEYYTSDITRTFPIGKRFSPAQAEIYDLVLKAQMAVLEVAKPGTRYSEMHRIACEVLTDGMLSMGLMKGKRDELIKNGGFRRFYPHGTGHFLGMDVHDVGLYQKNGESRVLEAGMVFTVEPGFYVQPGDMEAPEKYRDIGIRIEDDILVTAKGHEVLTAGVPKKREEIEALRG
jgi:Xaa-Pro aminopeptidase